MATPTLAQQQPTAPSPKQHPQAAPQVALSFLFVHVSLA